MESVQGLVANMNVNVLKEPKGFMKVLQFLFTICAFATTTSFSSSFKFIVECTADDVSSISGDIEYNFQLDHLRAEQKVCGNMQKLSMRGDVSGDAEFFVFVGVISWLIVIAAIVLYTVFHPIYSSNPNMPLVDCAVHLLLAFLWLAASAAWSSGVTTLKTATSFDVLKNENLQICGVDGLKCRSQYEPSFGKLDISIILGFLNMFLFASNIWFLYKETAHFQARKQQQQNQQQFMPPPQQEVPPQQLPQQY